MAWGGTNLHASVSDLYAVDETELSSRPERLKTRFWFDEEFALRESALGPVLSDSEAFRDGAGETLALRWTGHRPTDEITALLRANRAATPEAFRQAFAGYGSPPMHMLYAHVSGEIGAFPAMLLPEREPMVPRDLVRDPDEPGAMWSGFKETTEFAWLRDPERGYVVSANTPLDYVQDELGYAFAPPDRARRLAELVEAVGELDAGGVAAIQRDVASASAEKLAAMLAEELRRSGADGKLSDTLAAWDGRYGVESRGAAAFEAALSPLLDGLYGEEPGYRSEWNYLRVFLADDLSALPDAERDDLLRGVAEKARASLADHPDWGSMHRLRVGHILKGLPVLGRFFVLGEEPYPGSRETIFKASHGPSRSVVHPTYGAQSRHISDLSDPDANRFVLMGGQDGWLGSADFDGQVPLWLRGEYVNVPLTEAGARETFSRRMELRGGR
nr:penicillin acylase family protein [Desulfohalovibrio reitneri]